VPTYARISGDQIVEIFTPPPNISIDDCFHQTLLWVDITGHTPDPQPGWSAVFQSGIWILTEPVVPTPTPAQQATSLLELSALVESTSDQTLNAAYPVGVEARMNVMAEMISLNVNGTFTNGETSVDWLDINSQIHTFDADHFRSYARVIGAYITALKQVAAGIGTTLPAQPLQIM
jgi:hypothetical protein